MDFVELDENDHFVRTEVEPVLNAMLVEVDDWVHRQTTAISVQINTISRLLACIKRP